MQEVRIRKKVGNQNAKCRREESQFPFRERDGEKKCLHKHQIIPEIYVHIMPAKTVEMSCYL